MSQVLFKNYKPRRGLLQRLFETSQKIKALPTRLYSNGNKSEKEEELDAHSFAYKDTASEYATGKKPAVSKLQQLFKLRKFTADGIATRFKKLQLATGKTISDNFHMLQQEGVTDDVILNYPDVLAQRYLEEKISLLKELPFKLSDTVPLLNIDIIKFSRFIHKQAIECSEIPGGRIGYLSRLLELSIIDTCDIITRREFLHNADLKKVEVNYKLLIGFGIKTEDIKKDYWVLQYNTDRIKHRLDLAKKLNVDKMKTWMVRAQPEIFDTYIKRRSDNKLILGDNSLVEYLCERLQCTVEQSKIILSKHPALSSKSMRKMKEIIDFLYGDGFTPLHIVRNPKILLHSVETTRKRLKELEAQGMKVESLHILTKSQKQYMQYYENLVKSNKSKIKDKV